MKKLFMGMAFGVLAGLMLSEIPEVKQLMGSGKKKLKDIAK